MRTRELFMLVGWFTAACVVTEQAPLGPMEGTSGEAPNAPGSAPRGEGPANLGTDVFALCNGGDEQPGPRLLRLLTRRELQNTLRDLLFVTPPEVTTLPLEARVRGFDNNAHAQAVTSRHVDAYLALAEGVADKAVREQRGQLLPCDPGAADCATRFVREFGLRAFRRPLHDDEVTRYAALFASDLTAGSFDAGMRLAISAMLISPHFLYRSEVGEAHGDGTFLLTPYEVASALSYLYWASMPDAALFEAARENALQTPEQLAAQAERMLADPRAKQQLGEFSLQWLRSDNLLSAFKDSAIYPDFQDAVREAMIEEQKRFFVRVVLEQEGRFADLLLADYVLANQPLAAFYGLSGGGPEFPVVPASASSGRGGILGLGAVLAAHAHSNESSPIRRGLFVRDRLLCQDLPSPPEDLDTSPPQLDPAFTTRQRFERHTSDPKCQSCHKFIDGIGNGLEHYDGVGKRRETENGLPVDARGEVLGLEGIDKDTRESFEGPQQLADMLAVSPTAQACFSLQFYRFARGYEERKSDACSLQSLKERFEQADLSLKQLLIALPQLTSFSVRSAE